MFPPTHALVDGGDASRRRREQRLLQRHSEQIAAAHRRRFPRDLHGQQRLERGFFRSGSDELVAEGLPILKGPFHFVGDVFLEAADHQPFVSKIGLLIIVRVRNSGGVQHVHQAGETAGAAIVRRGGEHDERV